MGQVKGLGKNVSDLVWIHKGRPAVVIGGAPSRISDDWFWNEKAKNPVVLSANDHGYLQTWCDYGVCCEDLEQRMRLQSVPVISRHVWADYRIFDKPIPNSAILAAFAAWVMGCAPIIITGVECYIGKTYLHDPDLKTSGHNVPLKTHLVRWARLPNMAPGIQVRAVSGPLLDIFKKYGPEEKPYGVNSEELILSLCQGKQMEMLREEYVGRHLRKKGEIIEVAEIEAHSLWRQRIAKRVGT